MSCAAERSAVLLFDGVCNLCTGSVRFVIRRDPHRRFRFASLQSPIARELLGPGEEAAADRLDSVVLIDEDGIWHKSTAALRTARRLSGLWPLMSVFLIVPRPIRDALYDFIGSRRYRLFGRTQACWVPDEDLSDRFLDAPAIREPGREAG